MLIKSFPGNQRINSRKTNYDRTRINKPDTIHLHMGTLQEQNRGTQMQSVHKIPKKVFCLAELVKAVRNFVLGFVYHMNHR